MNSQKSQAGSAHVIIIIALIVLLIGALGFIFWQNFMNNKSDTAQSTTQTETVEDTDEAPIDEIEAAPTNTYTGDRFSFEYPTTDWKVASETTANPTITLESDDYKPAVGMGIDAGATISVTVAENSQTIDQDITTTTSAWGFKDVTKFTTNNGDSAYSYKLEYEGVRYGTVILNGDRKYTIVYMTADGQYDTYKNAYDTIVSSFKAS